jgi:uncharacterized membrane protein YhaH (DUF805 family)
MTFTESISTCFNKYANFEGTASRSEYWWFWLFLVLASVAASMINDVVYYLFALATLLPQLAVGVRRLHDTDRSGWWLLVGLVPLVGWIILIVFLAQEGKSNRYGVSAVPV